MASANGGIIGKDNIPVDNGQAEVISTFNASGTLTTGSQTTLVSYLVIAGGAGSQPSGGGGGGAGVTASPHFKYKSLDPTGYTLRSVREKVHKSENVEDEFEDGDDEHSKSDMK